MTASSRSRFEKWCTYIAYTLGGLAVLGILAIVIRSEVISS